MTEKIPLINWNHSWDMQAIQSKTWIGHFNRRFTWEMNIYWKIEDAIVSSLNENRMERGCQHAV